MPILILIVVINSMGFGMIVPLLPIIRDGFGLHEAEIGYLVGVFGIASMGGSILFGIISDKYGRKIALFIPSLLSSLAYFGTAEVTTYHQLLFFRLLSGFLMGSFSVAFVAASDMSTPKTRLKYMGGIGAAFSVGLIVSPAFGGYLILDDVTRLSETFHLLFRTSGAITLFASIVVLLFFKETITKKEREEKICKSKPSIFKQFIMAYSSRDMMLFSGLLIFFMSVLAGVQVYIGIWLHDIFSFTASNIGLYWSITAIVIALSQVVVYKIFKTIRSALITGFIFLTMSFVILIFTTNYLMLAIACVLLSFAMGFISPSITTRVSLEGSKNQQGLILGVSQSIGGLGRAIGPNIFGHIYTMGYNYMWGVMGICSIILLLLVIVFVDHTFKHKESR